VVRCRRWQDRVKEQKAARTAARRDRQHPEDDAVPDVVAPAPEPAPKIAVAKRPAERTNAPTAAPAQAAPEQPASAMGPAESGTDADAKKKKWASWKEKKQLKREQKASRTAAAASRRADSVAQVQGRGGGGLRGATTGADSTAHTAGGSCSASCP
jgi:hypothetical protein